MNFVFAPVVVVGFAATIEYLDLPERARPVGRRSSDALAVLRDGAMSDRENEEVLQRQALRLFGLLGILVGGGPLAAVWLPEQVGVGSFWGTLAVLERIDFLVGVTVVGLAGYLLIRWRREA